MQPIEKLPHPVQLRGSPLARWVLALFGWRVRFDGLPALQGVFAVYPHTSNWDFIVAILAKWAVGLNLKMARQLDIPVSLETYQRADFVHE